MRLPPFRGNIVVSNLPSQLTPSELASLFDDYGLVLGAKIERWHDRPGGSQGLIDLAPDNSVEKAIEALDGHAVGAHKISVKRQQKQAKRAAPKRAAPAAERAPHTGAPVQSVPYAAEFAARPAATRKVVVEYRTPPRRVVIPPRAASPAGS
ncbi:MAG TPA: RNA-binding protein [Stellaceae bacterium]|nr:RNA-binding protein [Stellaceae bacterium]